MVSDSVAFQDQRQDSLPPQIGINLRFGPYKRNIWRGLKIRDGVNNHVGIRVEFVVKSNLPHLRSIEIWLRNAKDDKNRNQANQLKRH